MHLKKDEITLLYNSERSRDRQVLAYARTITDKINKQDLCSANVSSTLFELMVEMLGEKAKNILNKAHPYYQNELRGSELSVRMWFLALKKNPDLLKAPVAIYKGRYIICDTPTDILKIQTELNS